MHPKVALNLPKSSNFRPSCKKSALLNKCLSVEGKLQSIVCIFSTFSNFTFKIRAFKKKAFFYINA